MEPDERVPEREVEEPEGEVCQTDVAHDGRTARRRLRLSRAEVGARHPIDGRGSEEDRQNAVSRHEQAPQAPGLAVRDGSLLEVAGGPGELVVVEVPVASQPGVHGARPEEPHAEHHRVLDERPATEVEAVNEVVLELVEERHEDRRGGDRHPRGHYAPHIEHRVEDDRGDAEGEDRRADGVLVAQDGMALPQPPEHLHELQTNLT